MIDPDTIIIISSTSRVRLPLLVNYAMVVASTNRYDREVLR